MLQSKIFSDPVAMMMAISNSSQWSSTAKPVRTPCLTFEVCFRPIASCLSGTCIDRYMCPLSIIR